MAEANEIAQALLEQTVPVLRCHPGLKRPWANVERTWDSIDDPDNLTEWLKHGDNLAVLLGHDKGSPILGVGLDTYKNTQVMDFAKEHSVTFKGATWSQRSGRGGYTLFYQPSPQPREVGGRSRWPHLDGYLGPIHPSS